MGRYTTPQLRKIDGPRLRANASELSLIEQAAFLSGRIPAEFVAHAALNAARQILRELYLEQPAAFERVLGRAASDLHRDGYPLNRATFSALLNDLDVDDIQAMRSALGRCGITVDLPRTDWTEVVNG